VINQAPNKLHEEVKAIRNEVSQIKSNVETSNIVTHPSAIPIKSQTDTNQINFDHNVKPAESMYTPVPVQLQNNNNEAPSSSTKIPQGSGRKEDQ